MAAPSLISVTATVYNSHTSSKATASIAVQAGDILIAYGAAESSAGSFTLAIATTTGSNPSWTQREVYALNDVNRVYSSLWSGVAPTTQSVVVTFTPSITPGGPFYGGEVHVWRNSDGLGATDQNENAAGSGSPTLTFSTTQANSGLSVGVCDWNATTGTSTFTSTAGTPTEQTDFADGAHYGVHTATYADVSAAGSKTVGMSAPTTQRYQILAAEIKGTAVTTTDGAGTASSTGTASATGTPISMLIPDADITDGGWLTDTGGTNLFAAIDETPVSDTDYIVSSDTDTDTCEIRLSDPSFTLARPFSVAYRYKRIGTDAPTLRVQLMEGATSRASWDVAVSNDTFTDGEQFLTAPEFTAITDFTDLRVRFTAIRESALTLEGDFSGSLTLEGDFSGSLLLEGT